MNFNKCRNRWSNFLNFPVMCCWCNRITDSVMLFVDPRLLFLKQRQLKFQCLDKRCSQLKYTRNSGALFYKLLWTNCTLSHMQMCFALPVVLKDTWPHRLGVLFSPFLSNVFSNISPRRTRHFFVSSTTMISRFEFSITHFSLPIPHLVMFGITAESLSDMVFAALTTKNLIL